MKVFKTVLSAFSFFSIVPLPRQNIGTQESGFFLCAFPLVGLFIGILEFLWLYASAKLNFNSFLAAAGISCIPLIISGGLHMDGFCDTTDALASRAPREKKLEILSDPHIGSFAVLSLVLYCLLYVAFAESFFSFAEPAAAKGFFALITKPIVICFILNFPFSRSLSALAVLIFPCAKKSGLAVVFSTAAPKKPQIIFLSVFIAFLSGLLVFLGGFFGIFLIASAFSVFFIYKRIALKEFGGISGDLSGWFLQLCEITVLAALVFFSAIEHTLLMGKI